MSAGAGGGRLVVCAMSGGVDSSVAALLLRRCGYRVLGVFMRNWDAADEGDASECAAEQQRRDAQSVCRRLGVPFREADFSRHYWTHVFDAFLADYGAGLTPNPDILCNRYVKFDRFFDYAMSLRSPWDGQPAWAVATGHYARSSFGAFLEHAHPTAPARLLKAADAWKDQTFFLSQMPQRALRRTLFPLGDLTKAQVRALARDHGLGDIARRPESMGICFIGSRNFQDFIREYVEDRPGKFLDLETGEVVGQHRGIHLYTVGQRCVVHSAAQHSDKHFVVEKNASTGDIVVARGSDHPALYTSSLLVGPITWITGSAPPELHLPNTPHPETGTTYQVPSGTADHKSCSQSSSTVGNCNRTTLDGSTCELFTENNEAYSNVAAVVGDGKPPQSQSSECDIHQEDPLMDRGHSQAGDPSELRVDFQFQHVARQRGAWLQRITTDHFLVTLVDPGRPLRAVTPGQFAVFYRGQECLGSGRILRPGPSLFHERLVSGMEASSAATPVRAPEAPSSAETVTEPEALSSVEPVSEPDAFVCVEPLRKPETLSSVERVRRPEALSAQGPVSAREVPSSVEPQRASGAPSAAGPVRGRKVPSVVEHVQAIEALSAA